MELAVRGRSKKKTCLTIDQASSRICRMATSPVTREVRSKSSPFCSTNIIDFTVLASTPSTLSPRSPPSFPNRRIRTDPEIHSPTPTTTSSSRSHTASALISSAKLTEPSAHASPASPAAPSRSTSSRAKLPTARKRPAEVASCTAAGNATKPGRAPSTCSPEGVTNPTLSPHCATCSVRNGRSSPSGRNARSRRTNRCVLEPYPIAK